jgi:hypothetical protein
MHDPKDPLRCGVCAALIVSKRVGPVLSLGQSRQNKVSSFRNGHGSCFHAKRFCQRQTLRYGFCSRFRAIGRDKDVLVHQGPSELWP